MSIVGRALSPRRAAAPQQKSTSWVDWPWSSQPPDWVLRLGVPGEVRWAVGVPALLAVLRAITNAAQQCPLIVYSGDGDARERARTSPQWRLLHGAAEPRVPSSRLVADAALSLAGCGNWYGRKIAGGGNVMRIVSLDARRILPERAGGEIVYRDRGNGAAGSGATLYPGEIIHARMAAVGDDLVGLSPISALRTVTAASLERREFEQRVMANDARPGIVFKSAQPPDSADEADAWVERWMSRHGGPANAGRPTIISADDDIVQLPVNLADLQFVEQNRSTREELAGVYQLPLSYAGADRSPTYEDRQQLALLCIGPIVGALADTLNVDLELFPPGSGLSCEPLYDALLQTSVRERYEAYRLARQGGWVTANELRRRENLGPIEGGDQIQQTPVGGAPNSPPAN